MAEVGDTVGGLAVGAVLAAALGGEAAAGAAPPPPASTAPLLGAVSAFAAAQAELASFNFPLRSLQE
eukprot:1220164-Pleurochrysis_carterae.AAC.1